MYFWDIKALKNDFLQGRFSQTQAFYYLILLLVLFILPVGVVGDSTTIWDKAMFWCELVFVVFGTAVVYKSNGGRDGKEFLERYVSLSWVLFLRIIPLAILIFILTIILQDVLLGNSGNEFTVYTFAAVVLVNLIFYWRLSHHMGELSQASFSGGHVSAEN